MTVPLFPDALRDGTFVAGGPESAGFCDGPGPGMALEQNPFPARVPPGSYGVRPSHLDVQRLLNITKNV